MRYPCILCNEATATDPAYPCESCVASDLAQEEEVAEAMEDREEYLRHHNWDELTVGERADLESWLDDIG